VRVIPSVVVDENRSVGHGSNLIAVVPPGHDLGVGGRVVSQPIVGLSEIVEDDLVTIVRLSRQYNRGARVSLRGHPCAVECIARQQEAHEENHTGRNLS
jgi:hypothetical protein